MRRNHRCPHCGRLFIAHRSNAVYCTVTCRVAAHRERERVAARGVNLRDVTAAAIAQFVADADFLTRSAVALDDYLALVAVARHALSYVPAGAIRWRCSQCGDETTGTVADMSLQNCKCSLNAWVRWDAAAPSSG